MDRHEFSAFAAALRTFFPRCSVLPNEEAMSLWYTALRDLPYPVLSAALLRWVSTEKWPPTVAELRAMTAEIASGELPDWGEAWCEVTRAVRRFGWSRPQEALPSLSPLAQAAVRRIGWAQICASENPDTLRAQFRQVYEICCRREVQDRQIPESLKAVIACLGPAGDPAPDTEAAASLITCFPDRPGPAAPGRSPQAGERPNAPSARGPSSGGAGRSA